MPCLVCLHRKRINISTVLAGQRLGIKEVDEGIWLASFMGRFLSKAAEGARAHETLLPMLTQQQRRRSALDRRNPQVKSALCPLCLNIRQQNARSIFPSRFGLTRIAVLV